MATASRTAEREEERRHNMRTLAVASTASASAALLVSQLWIAGTWIAAALTPVIVAFVSEMLNRPADRLARTLTTDRRALPDEREEVLPEAGGAAPPARPGVDPLPTRAPAEPGPEPPVRVYRAGADEPVGTRPGASRRRKIAYGAVFGTAALAFLIAVIIITVPELLAGGSVGKRDGGSTFFGSSNKKADRDRDQQAPQDTTEAEDEQPQREEQPQQTAPEEEQPTTPEEAPPADEQPPEETAPPGEPLPEQVPPVEQP